MKLVLLCLGVFFFSSLQAARTVGLPPVPIPDSNHQTIEKIELGHLLFNDKRFSADGTVSCASCHDSKKAFTDGLPVAQGIKNQRGTRNTPTIINAAFYSQFFHDGRARSLEEQALGPFVSPIEHGLENHQFIVDIVRKDKIYRRRFQSVFGLTEKDITIEHIVKAIASFERSLVAGSSPFDHYYFAGNKSALTESAARGLRLFRRKGNCANCHEISWNNALFTDNRFYNIGVGSESFEMLLEGFILALKGDKPHAQFRFTEKQKSALGRFNVTKVIADIGKFKTPTLRNIALTGPYMHDGSIKTLHEVIEYYDQGGNKNRFLDAAIFPLHLTVQEKRDLVVFLNALTSPEYK